MDSLDRLFRHLVRSIRANYPQYLSQPFEVAELYQTIMPYRHNRRELSMETNQDYEMSLLELLSGARGYLVVEDRMRDTLARELASPNPDPGAFREFATAQVSLSPDAVQQLEAGADGVVAAASRSSAADTQRVSAARTSVGATSAAPVSTMATSSAAASDAPQRASSPVAPSPAVRTSGAATVVADESCRYCGGVLPQGRRVVFCPHCGQNLTVVNCLACGTELELGWKFCTSCGRPTAQGGNT
jgi:double zinc ribbon protein